MHVIKCHDDVINAMCWNFDGSRIATTSKDKCGRIIDPRNTVDEPEQVGIPLCNYSDTDSRCK